MKIISLAYWMDISTALLGKRVTRAVCVLLLRFSMVEKPFDNSILSSIRQTISAKISGFLPSLQKKGSEKAIWEA